MSERREYNFMSQDEYGMHNARTLYRLVQLRVSAEAELAVRPESMSPDLTKGRVKLLDRMLGLLLYRNRGANLPYDTSKVLEEMRGALILARERGQAPEPVAYLIPDADIRPHNIDDQGRFLPTD